MTDKGDISFLLLYIVTDVSSRSKTKNVGSKMVELCVIIFDFGYERNFISRERLRGPAFSRIFEENIDKCVQIQRISVVQIK